MLNNIKDGIIAFLTLSLVFSLVSCAVMWKQVESARKEVAEAVAEKEAHQEIARVALTDAYEVREEFKDFKVWVVKNPPPKDTEGIRQWMLKAGKH